MHYFHFAIARQIGLAKRNAGLSWGQLRDAIDLKTGGELDSHQLDLLTDKAEHYQARERAKRENPAA